VRLQLRRPGSSSQIFTLGAGLVATDEGRSIAGFLGQGSVTRPRMLLGPVPGSRIHPVDVTAESETRRSGMATYSPKASEIQAQREWYVVDADGMVLGRMCTEIARVLKGKHKPIYAPHIDTGDHVIVINADKVVMTSGKAERTMKYRHSGYPGGIKSESYAKLHARKPAEAVRQSIRGMLPKGPLGRQQLTKLKVYAGPDHPHGSQQPTPMLIDHAQAR